MTSKIHNAIVNNQWQHRSLILHMHVIMSLGGHILRIQCIPKSIHSACILWSLQWRYNEHHGVSNHLRLHCLSYVCLDQQQRNHQSLCYLLWGEFIGDRWIPLTKGQLRENLFDMMTSSWIEFSSLAALEVVILTRQGPNKRVDNWRLTFSSAFLLYEKHRILIWNSPKFIRRVNLTIRQHRFQLMTWHRTGVH